MLIFLVNSIYVKWGGRHFQQDVVFIKETYVPLSWPTFFFLFESEFLETLPNKRRLRKRDHLISHTGILMMSLPIKIHFFSKYEVCIKHFSIHMIFKTSQLKTSLSLIQNLLSQGFVKQCIVLVYKCFTKVHGKVTKHQIYK